MKILPYQDWFDTFEEQLEDNCPMEENFEKWCKKQYELYKKSFLEGISENEKFPKDFLM